MREAKRNYKKCYIRIFVILAMVIIFSPGTGIAEPPKPKWVNGPAVVDLGKNLAQLSINEKYIFADSEDTKKIMEYMGNPLTNNEIGYLAPNDETSNWFIVFDYLPIGYVKDDEKDSIDSGAILKAIKTGTEKANKIRADKGFSPLIIKSWHNKPYYDENTHNLTWTLLAEQDGVELVNHNVRILGRHGYISVVLVSDVPTLSSCRAQLDEIVSNITYKQGKSYAEYVQGDKVAKYGLTALIAGGAAATATKFGLFKFLAKAWKFILIAVFGFFAALKNKIKSIFGRKESVDVPGQLEKQPHSSHNSGDSTQHPNPSGSQ
ncbi:MAG: DUF2167 domain-containing protein [Desulfobacterales bacterium]|nr:MAG: DUF2167 domain-containing protein [Desulfobacterales bacterium]